MNPNANQSLSDHTEGEPEQNLDENRPAPIYQHIITEIMAGYNFNNLFINS